MLVSVPHVLLVLLGTLAATPSHEEIVGGFFNKSGSAAGGRPHEQLGRPGLCVALLVQLPPHGERAEYVRPWLASFSDVQVLIARRGKYRTVKCLGIPDSNIILMLADDAACNARNKSPPGSVYANPGRELDPYGDNIEVDYRGYEVTVDNFIRVLTDEMEPSVPRSKRLLTDARSNIFVYMISHGGNEFLKF
ncbi:hypothetical protein C8R44DRAFT_876186 [Mycena epipterygia]|nr:hypothetical protein C8R44DRAFT_876186 [Mycena epipterygia]